MIRTRTNGLLWHGTNAERLLNFPSPTDTGMIFRETDTDEVYVVWGNAWVSMGLPDSPHDGLLYGRKDGQWVEVA